MRITESFPFVVKESTFCVAEKTAEADTVFKCTVLLLVSVWLVAEAVLLLFKAVKAVEVDGVELLLVVIVVVHSSESFVSRTTNGLHIISGHSMQLYENRSKRNTPKARPQMYRPR